MKNRFVSLSLEDVTSVILIIQETGGIVLELMQLNVNWTILEATNNKQSAKLILVS